MPERSAQRLRGHLKDSWTHRRDYHWPNLGASKQLIMIIVKHSVKQSKSPCEIKKGGGARREWKNSLQKNAS